MWLRKKISGYLSLRSNIIKLAQVYSFNSERNRQYPSPLKTQNSPTILPKRREEEKKRYYICLTVCTNLPITLIVLLSKITLKYMRSLKEDIFSFFSSSSDLLLISITMRKVDRNTDYENHFTHFSIITWQIPSCWISSTFFIINLKIHICTFIYANLCELCRHVHAYV